MPLEFILFWTRETLSNLIRNRLMSLLAMSTVAIGLFILGGFYLSLAHVREMVKNQTGKLNITVILDPNITPTRRKQIYEACRIPQVADLQIRTKDQVLMEMHRDTPDMAVSDLKGRNNPLSDELRLKVKDPQTIPAVIKYMQTLKGKGVDDTISDQAILQKLLSFNMWLTVIGSVSLIVLGLAILAIIYNTIRLTVHARRREIRIMELVGATRGFIRVPFVLEGIILGFCGALLAALFLVSFHSLFGSKMPVFLRAMSPEMIGQVSRQCAVGVVFAGLFFGLVGSCISLNRSITRAALQN
jgi:cell division transport system permease protein